MKVKLHGADTAKRVFQALIPGLKTPLPKKGKTLQITMQVTVRLKDGFENEYEVSATSLKLSQLLEQAEREGAAKVMASLDVQRTSAWDSFFSNPFGGKDFSS